MSIRVMNAVWSKAPYEGGALLVLLAMADWADDHGYCWPSVRTLAKKSRQTERNVRKCLRRMARDGAISVEPGAGPHRTNLYRIKFVTFCEIRGQTGEELCSGLNEVPSENCIVSPLSLVPVGEERSSANTSIEPSVDTSSGNSLPITNQGEGQHEKHVLGSAYRRQKARSSKVEQGSTPESEAPDLDSEFDGHLWCLRTVKSHPLWKTPDAVDVPATISDPYTKAVEIEAKRFNGDRTKAAEDILAKTECYAAKVKAGTEKLFGTIASYFKGAIYNSHAPTGSFSSDLVIEVVSIIPEGPTLLDKIKANPEKYPDWAKPQWMRNGGANPQCS